MIITIVGADQECSGAIDGIAASEITKESLFNVGIKSNTKDVEPNWWFISFSFLFILLFVYGAVGLFIYTYNQSLKETELLQREVMGSKQSIYYDKIAEIEQGDVETSCFGLIKTRRQRRAGQNKIDAENEDDGPVFKDRTKHEYAVNYGDMEKLLNEFNSANAQLKSMLKDRDRRAKLKALEGLDESQRKRALETAEDELLSEMYQLLDFVKENREAVEKYTGTVLSSNDVPVNED